MGVADMRVGKKRSSGVLVPVKVTPGNGGGQAWGILFFLLVPRHVAEERTALEQGGGPGRRLSAPAGLSRTR